MVVTTLQKHRIEYGIQGGGGLGAVAGGAVEADQGGAGVVRLGHRPEVQRPLRSGFSMNSNMSDYMELSNCAQDVYHNVPRSIDHLTTLPKA